MANITIYLPDEIEKKARKAARNKKTSVSRWIAAEIEKSLKTTWPQSFLDAAGAFPDFPDIGELRSGYGEDAPREHID